MGADKAFVAVDGVAMVQRVAGALSAGGAASVVCIGGDRARLGRLGLSTVDDDRPGEGPLAGLATALGWCDEKTLVVAGCDQPWLTASAITSLVVAHEQSMAPATVYRAEGIVQPLPGVFDISLLADLTVALTRGERALAAALRVAEPFIVEATEPDALRDVDRPEDLRPR
ncbi:MAG: NTP transferase domain-containing protein [Actinomycetota bacterium]|nr:NTP transferase domain-containing protein [Actinomycetota bacterium]